MLASGAMGEAPNDKEAAAVCFELIGLEDDKYRLGHTKLFFRTGVVALLEELREGKIQEMMRCMQVVIYIVNPPLVVVYLSFSPSGAV